MPTDIRLLGVRVKLARAWHHLKTLDPAIGEWFKDPFHLPGIQGVFDLSQEWQELMWQGVKPMPPYWGAILGDFAHNARSALDHLIWVLVDANEGSPGPHTQFPVSETEGKWRDDIEQRDVTNRGPAPTDGLSDKAFRLVYEFQPFHETERGWDGKKLFQLLRVSNEDKHRRLLATFPYSMRRPEDLRFEPAGYVAIERIRYGHATGRPIENGTHLASVKIRLISRPPPGVVVHVRFRQQTNVSFRAGDDPLVDATDLRPILFAVRSVLRGARELPEIA